MKITKTTPSEPIGIKRIEYSDVCLARDIEGASCQYPQCDCVPTDIKPIEMSERDKRVLAAKQRYVAKKAGEKQ
jgi:hypothetical protein